MDSSTDRSAQVAHVLHGTRPAEPGEDACFDCGVLLCSFCAVDGEMCQSCYDEREQQDAEYDLYDADEPGDEPDERNHSYWGVKGTKK